MNGTQLLATAVKAASREDLESFIYAARVGYVKAIEWAEAQFKDEPRGPFKEEPLPPSIIQDEI